ncbi:DUF488 domain-containing protein [Marinobacterium aestuariivivens]|uniref:DUF488 domain-containing protein n=1 Tax=Marinobacterium aestuariivivens TaxID=1698799 RepID=A0ABW2A9W4_9GAMM
MALLKLKRVYDPVESDDGSRVLVDRLWPRGIARKDLSLDLWLKDIAPSDELRRWYGHESDKWPEFKRRYLAELACSEEALDRLRALLQKGAVTLLYAARDTEHNQAVVLKELLESS